MIGIYCIRFFDCFYVGQSKCIEKRLSGHYQALKSNRHRNCKLQRAWNKHGFDKFEFEVIEVCDFEKLTCREQYWIDMLDCIDMGFNITRIAGPPAGEITDETRKKMSNASRKRECSLETRQKISEARKGHLVSEETRKKIGLVHKGKIHSLETRQKIAEKCKGRRHTLEELQKQSKAQTGKRKGPIAETTRQKLKNPSLETLQKMSNASKNRKHPPRTEELKQKMSKLAKERWNNNKKEKMKVTEQQNIEDV